MFPTLGLTLDVTRQNGVLALSDICDSVFDANME